MPPDKIRPYNDPRITLRSALLNGHTYGYLYATPPASTPHRGTIVLIHGFPDLSLGWRYQIPLFLSLGLTVIAPDCMGYGRTDAPPASSISAYTFARISSDIATLCAQLHIRSIILGGHDWGGAIVYRVAQYQPALVSHVFSICTPYFTPQAHYEPLAQLVKTRLPNFAYQQHLASGAIEEAVQSKAEIRAFLNALYGARVPGSGEVGFQATSGVLLENLPRLGANVLLDASEMDYYVDEYARHGINGPLNWYRNREANWEDEWRAFFHEGAKGDDAAPVITQETLFVLATKDAALRPFMAARMAERIPHLTRREVVAGHWALWEKPDECNRVIREWLEEKVFRAGRAGTEKTGKL